MSDLRKLAEAWDKKAADDGEKLKQLTDRLSLLTAHLPQPQRGEAQALLHEILDVGRQWVPVPR